MAEPQIPIEKLIWDYEWIWHDVDGDPEDFFWSLADRGIISWDDAGFYIQEYYNTSPVVPTKREEPPPRVTYYPPLPYSPRALEYKEGEEKETIAQLLTGYLAEAYDAVIRSLWPWILEQIKSLIDLVVNTLKPAISEAWESVSGKLQEFARNCYELLKRQFGEPEPMTPERAPGLAATLYVDALGLGMAAHGVSAAFEILHPLKSMGLHSTAAMIGDYAQFGRISGAIAGTLVNRVLGQAMTYNWQAMYRPRIPDERLLIEFRAKREIDKAEFDKYMAYQGYSKFWIDIIEAWQWKDPRMFEILRDTAGG